MKASEKDYWRGKGPNPKTLCSCGRYMRNAYAKATVDGKVTSVKIGLVCKCGAFAPDKDGLDKLSD